ncbi:MAG TPA: choice-of-anchor L domain-containing protein [Thermoanaerobaculia bacterium]
MGKRVVFCVAIALAAVSASAVTTKDMAAGLTAEQLAQALTGGGITITNVKVTGAQNAIGTFTGGAADGLAIDSGVIMSSGDIKTAAGPNTSEGTSTSLGTAGDPQLDSLVAPFHTHDAIVIEFDAVTVTNSFSIRYVFASEEYKEFVGSEFNDVFAFFVDGQNIALVPGTSLPVAVNTINQILNSSLYHDNPAGSGFFGTSFDGFTSELTAFAVVDPNVTHHVKLAIADTSDSILDSAVFLAQGGISGVGAAAVIPSVTEFATTSLESDTVDVTVFGVPDNFTPVLSASGLPPDSTVTFTPNGFLGPNTPLFKMKITIGPDTPGATYELNIRAVVANTESFAHISVVVDCRPPMILSLPGNQPVSTTADASGKATLKVVPNGSSGFRYQWYQGPSGSTYFPIAGATSSTLTTPAVTVPTDFWVRVTNACGSIDSAAATVTPQ